MDLTLSLPSEDVQYKDVPHTQMLYTKLSHTHTVTPMATPTHNISTHYLELWDGHFHGMVGGLTVTICHFQLQAHMGRTQRFAVIRAHGHAQLPLHPNQLHRQEAMGKWIV